MKYLILFSLTLSQVAWSQIEDPTFRRGLDAISNPSLLLAEDCDPNDPNSAPWCKDLFKAACSVEKTTNKYGDLHRQILEATYHRQPANATTAVKNETHMSAIRLAEREVFSKGSVKRPEVVQLFMDAKSVLFREVTSNPALTKAKQDELSRMINAVDLRTGAEYIQELETWALSQNPNISKDRLREQTLKMYSSSCGSTGMEKNAFFEKGKLILCPGLVYSLEDYNVNNKEQILNALAFTVGHEIGHAIDSKKFPEIYTKMAQCYNSNYPGQWNDVASPEIVGDYWGTLVMAKRMDYKKSHENATTVALAIDGFCEEYTPIPSGRAHKQAVHPPGMFRVNQTIGKVPQMRAALNCDPASPNSPACTIGGANPRPDGTPARR